MGKLRTAVPGQLGMLLLLCLGLRKWSRALDRKQTSLGEGNSAEKPGDSRGRVGFVIVWLGMDAGMWVKHLSFSR